LLIAVGKRDILSVSISAYHNLLHALCGLCAIEIQTCTAFGHRSYLVAMASLALLASLSTLLLHAYGQTIIATNTGDQTQIVSNGVTIIDGTTMSSCPGAAVLTKSGSHSGAYCCIEKNSATATASMCAGFPFCSDSTADPMTIFTPSCEALIPMTASDYAQLVVSATSSVSMNSASLTAAPASTSSASAQTTGNPTSTASSATQDNAAACIFSMSEVWIFSGLWLMGGVFAVAA